MTKSKKDLPASPATPAQTNKKPKKTQEQILAEATAFGEQWKAAFTGSGAYNERIILQELFIRTHDEAPCYVLLAKGLKEDPVALTFGVLLAPALAPIPDFQVLLSSNMIGKDLIRLAALGAREDREYDLARHEIIKRLMAYWAEPMPPLEPELKKKLFKRLQASIKGANLELTEDLFDRLWKQTCVQHAIHTLTATLRAKSTELILEDLRPETGERTNDYAILLSAYQQSQIAIAEHALEPNTILDAKATLKELKKLQPHECLWDYYLMALYECSSRELQDEQPHEFLRYSFFEAFKHGLGQIVNLHGFILAVLQPQIHFNERRQFHREDGPAIIYADGSKSYWWNSISIPEEWIEKRHELTAKMAIDEPNQERKRILYEIIGYERIIRDLGARTLAQDSHGELLEANLGDDGGKPARFLRVTCPSTGRIYVNRVDPSCKTPASARASRWGLSEDDFDLLWAET